MEGHERNVTRYGNAIYMESRTPYGNAIRKVQTQHAKSKAIWKVDQQNMGKRDTDIKRALSRDNQDAQKEPFLEAVEIWNY